MTRLTPQLALFALAALVPSCATDAPADDDDDAVVDDGLPDMVHTPIVMAPRHGAPVFTTDDPESTAVADVDDATVTAGDVAGAVPEAAATHGIAYHGGPVMLGETKLFYIYYGDVTDATKRILQDFARNIGGSPYFALNTLYHDGAGRSVASSVAYGGSTHYGTYLGRVLTDAEIERVVHDALASGRLPRTAHGVYFVIAGQNVDSPGMCIDYCAWHNANRMLVKDARYYKYGFIGNPGGCPEQCESETTSPNGHPIADSQVNLVAHELDEAVTDPRPFTAWFDRNHNENADKCAWIFPRMTTRPNGSFSNIHLGDRYYLIQANWLNAGSGGCRMRKP